MSSKSNPYELKGSTVNNYSWAAGTHQGCPEQTRVHSRLRGCCNPRVPAEAKIACYFRVVGYLGLWLRTRGNKERWAVSHQTWLQVTETALRLAWVTRRLIWVT